jgi:hypothetical protein
MAHEMLLPSLNKADLSHDATEIVPSVAALGSKYIFRPANSFLPSSHSLN